MNTDIRISVSFRAHRKRKKLSRLLGPGSTDFLIDLWIATALNHPDGVLFGMDEEDIALEAGFEGDAKDFVGALVRAGFLDETDEGFALHDWDVHQSWASGAQARSEKAKRAAKARWNKSDKQNDSMPQAQSKNAPSMPEHSNEDATSIEPPQPRKESHATRIPMSMLNDTAGISEDMLENASSTTEQCTEHASECPEHATSRIEHDANDFCEKLPELEKGENFPKTVTKNEKTPDAGRKKQNKELPKKTDKNAPSMLNDAASISEHMPLSFPFLSKVKRIGASAPLPPLDFNLFWEILPKVARNCGKIAAKKAWDKARKSKDWPGDGQALDAYARQVLEWEKEASPFICHATRWLNEGRWDTGDDVEHAQETDAAAARLRQDQERQAADAKYKAEQEALSKAWEALPESERKKFIQAARKNNPGLSKHPNESPLVQAQARIAFKASREGE